LKTHLSFSSRILAQLKMHSFTYSITLLVAFTGFTLAQQTSAVPTAGSSSSTAVCEAQKYVYVPSSHANSIHDILRTTYSIVDACLTSMKPQLEACGPNDWKCLCEQSNNVLT
jgi:hypothetical protein